MTVDALKIAQEYAKQNGKDTVRPAGERNGYKYFHVFLWETRKHKLGIQQFVKISTTGKITTILPVSEIMWAIKQEIALNNL
jgi:hypothetical protein